MSEGLRKLRERIVKELRAFEEAQANLTDLGQLHKWHPDDCPIKGDDNHYEHRHRTQALWGTGCWGWDCLFCGKEFEE